MVDQIIYLVGTLWEYKDVKQFAIHRFKQIELTETPVVKLDEFELNDYIQKGSFEYLADGDTEIQLKLKVNPWIKQHLSESRLSEDQEIKEIDGQYELTATVKNTHQLRWWLMSFGEGVEILEPISLRDEFKQALLKLNEIYK